MRIIRIGSRESALAIAQATIVMDAIRRACPNVRLELVTMKTTGDKIQDRPLDAVGGKGLFTKELDAALRDGRIDLAVHSYKDLPVPTPPDLPVVATPKREDPRDVLVLPEGATEPGPAADKPIGTSSLRRRLQIAKIFPAHACAPVRGNIQTRLQKLDNGEFGALVLAAAGLKRLNLQHRIHRYFEPEEMLPAACQGILAVQARAEEEHPYLAAIHDPETFAAATAERAFLESIGATCASPVAAYAETKGAALTLRTWNADETETGAGKIILVGAGPGDPALLTIAAQAAIADADTILYDKLIGEEIIHSLPQDAEKIDVGKTCGRHPTPQEEINRLLVEHARQGKTVVRLKGGDPFLFGRGAEELAAAAARGIPFRVIPGVTSATAAPACAGIPVTHRDLSSSLHIFTGHGKADKTGEARTIPYAEAAKLGGTLVFLMSLGATEEICNKLIEAGMPPATPAALVENGTRPTQRRLTATLATLPAAAREQSFSPPSILIVGKVCTLAATLDWTTRFPLPLHGRRILVAGAATTAARLAAMLRAKGAAADEFAAITRRPLPLPEDFWTTLPGYDWITLTSEFAVDTLFAALEESPYDVRIFAKTKFATVGERTKQTLHKKGIRADCIPATYNARALAETLITRIAPGESVLLFRAETAAPDLPEELQRNNIPFKEIAAYRTTKNPLPHPIKSALADNRYHAVAFTSASAVDSFASAFEESQFPGALQTFCIGASTARAAAQHNLPATTAPEATLESLCARIKSVISKSPNKV